MEAANNGKLRQVSKLGASLRIGRDDHRNLIMAGFFLSAGFFGGGLLINPPAQTLIIPLAGLTVVSFVAGFLLLSRRWGGVRDTAPHAASRTEPNIFNKIPDAVILVDSDGVILDWNLGAAKLFGFGKHEIVGKTIFGLIARPAIGTGFQLAKSGNDGMIENTEIECVGKNQKRINVLFVQVPAGDSEQAPERLLLFGRDITEYKQLQEQVLQTEKLAAIGRFAAEIAHQLNTPLGSILLSAQMLQDANLSSDERDDVEKIIRQVNHSKYVVRSLLDFSRNTSSVAVRTELNELIRRTVDLFRDSLRSHHIEVRCSLEPRGCFSKVYEHEIEQVVLNLLANAVDAEPDEGVISVRTSLYLERELILYFEDTGGGIPEEHLGKIFTPFFTTKEIGKGTGLGLPVCKRIVERHGGSIVVHSREGQGTLVVVKLPVNQVEKHYERV